MGGRQSWSAYDRDNHILDWRPPTAARFHHVALNGIIPHWATHTEESCCMPSPAFQAPTGCRIQQWILDWADYQPLFINRRLAKNFTSRWLIGSIQPPGHLQISP